MLSGDYLVTALVTQIQAMPLFFGRDLDNEPENLAGHADAMPDAISLTRAVNAEMNTPGCLVAYDGFSFGNFDGATVYRHRLKVFLRSGPVSLSQMVQDLTHDIPAGGAGDIRRVSIVREVDLAEFANDRYTDEEQIDLRVVTITLPEIFDN